MWYLDDGTTTVSHEAAVDILNQILILGPDFGLHLNMESVKYSGLVDTSFLEFPSEKPTDGISLLRSLPWGTEEYFLPIHHYINRQGS